MIPGCPAPLSRYVRTMMLFPPGRPLRLEHGGELTDVQVAYETYGTRDPRRPNTVFVCHALTGDSHPARHRPDDPPGWWEPALGPGKAIDTDRFHVVCANVLGGCAGTTGPWSHRPDSRAFGTAFPEVSVTDMVTVHRALLAHLGIVRLHAVVGGSLGGMQALDWLLRHPADAAVFALIATTARLSADNLAFNAIARTAIRTDPGFAGGRYADLRSNPGGGLGIARMIGHLTYTSEAALERKFGRGERPRTAPGYRPTAVHGGFEVERYLEHQAEKLAERFDANSYLYLTTAMDRFDPFAAKPRSSGWPLPEVYLHSFASDRLFGLEHSLELKESLLAAGLPSTHRHETSTTAGHDAFLLDVPGYLRDLGAELRAAGDGAYPTHRREAAEHASRRPGPSTADR
jgi:homoserine O-acetyltransferase/O-succinyltransferase